MKQLIDTHVHLWKYNIKEFGWIDDTMVLLKKNHLWRDYERNNRLMKVTPQGVLVQARQTWEETEFLCQVAQRESNILAVVGWISLVGAHISTKLATISSSPKYSKLVGFRHLLQDEADERYMLRDEFVSSLAELKKYGFIYEVLLRHNQLTQFVEYLQTVPQESQPVLVLDHAAKPPILGNETELEVWKQNITSVAKFPNIYCKFSGLLTEARWKNWKFTDFRPIGKHLLETFGPHRLMLGSDWPVCLLSGSRNESLYLFEHLNYELSEEDMEWINYKTAEKIYGKRYI